MKTTNILILGAVAYAAVKLWPDISKLLSGSSDVIPMAGGGGSSTPSHPLTTLLPSKVHPITIALPPEKGTPYAQTTMAQVLAEQAAWEKQYLNPAADAVNRFNQFWAYQPNVPPNIQVQRLALLDKIREIAEMEQSIFAPKLKAAAAMRGF